MGGCSVATSSAKTQRRRCSLGGGRTVGVGRARNELEGIGQVVIDRRIEVYALVGRLDEVISRAVEIESIGGRKCVEIASCWIQRIKCWKVFWPPGTLAPVSSLTDEF